MAEAQGILVVGEVGEAGIEPITYELMGAARGIAGDLGQEVAVALLGSGIEGLAPEVFARGADRLYLIDDPLLAEYRTDPFLDGLAKVSHEASPAVILLGQTNMGRDLAPRLAFRLGTAVATDCVALSVRDGRVVMSRPCYGGNVRADFVCKSTPQMATLRAKTFEPAAPGAGHSGQMAKLELGMAPEAVRTRVVGRVKAEAEGVRLEDAEVVVCGGRGLGGAEGFQTLEELARILGGAVGATRSACDMGWYPVANQIGLTGKVVTPALYIAVALSGASQHMAGCSSSKYIVAVNKDPEAIIFKAARFGIVADYRQVMPSLVAAVRALKG